jgi:hypothetical protein
MTCTDAITGNHRVWNRRAAASGRRTSSSALARPSPLDDAFRVANLREVGLKGLTPAQVKYAPTSTRASNTPAPCPSPVPGSVSSATSPSWTLSPLSSPASADTVRAQGFHETDALRDSGLLLIADGPWVEHEAQQADVDACRLV